MAGRLDSGRPYYGAVAIARVVGWVQIRPGYVNGELGEL